MQFRLKTVLKGIVLLACMFYAGRRIYDDGFSPIMIPLAMLAMVGVSWTDVAKSADPVLAAAAQTQWIERLTNNAEQQLADDSLPGHRRTYVVSLTCGSLPRVGQSSQAITFAEQHLPVAEQKMRWRAVQGVGVGVQV